VTEVSCSALLFDMDGVLTDSTKAVERVWMKWAIAHGFNPYEVAAKAHGRPSISTVRDYLPNADHAAENRIVERAEIEDLEGVVQVAGAEELLAKLPANRYAVVTSSTRALAEVRLRAVGLKIPEYFVTSSDIVNGKPHPEPYVKGAKELGFSVSECIVVEDVPPGIQAGKAAGCKVIALRTTTNESELLRAGADWVLDDCRQIDVKVEERRLSLRLQV